MTQLLRCTCRHEYQDQRYGQGQRIHNHATKDNEWRCTVCGTARKESTSVKAKEATKEKR